MEKERLEAMDEQYFGRWGTFALIYAGLSKGKIAVG